MKGLLVDVLHPAGRRASCTNGGLSATHDRFILVGKGIPELFESRSGLPLLILKRRWIGGREYLHAEPADRPEGIGWMFGGNFIYSSDSRFSSLYPIPIHDRQETRAEYDANFD